MMREWMYERVFPRWVPNEELRPRAREASGASLHVRWLGTAAHVIETATTRILIDPYLSRPGLGRLIGQPLEPDEALIFASVRTRIDAILCGHSHFDHLLDAPRIAQRTGAKLAGSRTTCAFGRASGLADDQLIEVPPSGRRFTIGDIDVRFVPSLHGRTALGRVPFPGAVDGDVGLPARAHHYKMGGAFGILLRAGGTSVYHNGSADLIDAELDGEHADVLLAGLALRRATRDYVARLVGALHPKLVIPTHHDAFFAPLDRGVHLLPGIDLEGFVSDVRAHAKGARVITPGYEEAIAISPGDAAESVIVD
jgi:L-ascorbate metabolism protein UlaG (beta-lactamase superfamily)